jgi:hypothetical protein
MLCPDDLIIVFSLFIKSGLTDNKKGGLDNKTNSIELACFPDRRFRLWVCLRFSHSS